MGHPAYQITSGSAVLDGQDILEMDADERSRAGLFLAFQYPLAIPGVTVANFLRSALQAHRGKEAEMTDFRKLLKSENGGLEIDRPSPRGISTTVSPAARRRGSRFFRWRCSSRHGDSRRNRFRARYRRPQDGCRGDQPVSHRSQRRAAGHALPATAELHQAGLSCMS